MKKVILSCEVCWSKNYIENKTKNERLIKNKYCKKCNSYQIHKEEK